jgi:hypothetical protein
MRIATVCALIAGASAAVPALAQDSLDEKVARTLADNRWSFAIEDGWPTGPGGEWILGNASEARFTLLGESHMTAETPVFVDALLRGLQPAGYNTYIVECGPVATEIVTRSIEDDGIGATEQLLIDNAFGIAFLDQREEMWAAARAMEMGYDVWGVDQEFIGAPRLLLRELVSLAQYDASRELAQSMLDRARAGFAHFAQTGDQSQAFITSATDDDYDALAASFEDEDGVAIEAIGQLRASAAVYRAYGEGRYFDNNSTRIDLMKRNFMAHIDENDLSPIGDWKAVFKAGTYHMGKGHTPMHVLDLGNFAHELAIASGSESFHIMVGATGKVGADGEVAYWLAAGPQFAPFYDQVDENGPVVFDLRPLRAVLTQAGKKSQELQDLQDMVLRFDAYVLYPVFNPSDALVPLPGR